jgi:hypothetical protein
LAPEIVIPSASAWKRFSPEFRLPPLVLLPESFRGGCSFGTGNAGFSQLGRRNYPAATDLGKGQMSP